MGGVEEVSLGSPGHQDDGIAGAPGYYADGLHGAPGYYADGMHGVTEPVMTLSGGGRVARRRSMGGQLRHEARAYGRRAQLAGLGGIVSAGFNIAGDVASGYISAKTGGAVQADISTEGVSVNAGPIVPGVIDGQTLFTTKDGTKTQLAPEAVAQVNTVRSELLKAAFASKRTYGKAGILTLIPKKKTPIVPIVVGAAAIGLLIWAL